MKRSITITAVSAVLAFVFVFAGCNRSDDDETRIASQNQTTQTSSATQAVSTTEAATTQAGPPQVIAYYFLNKTVPKDGMTAGFEVKLPKIDSSKPGAAGINAQINELKINVEQTYTAAGNLQDFNQIIKMSFKTAQKDSIIFISIETMTGYLASEGLLKNYHYAYNYITDQSVPKSAIAQMYGFSEAQILAKVNTDLANNGFDPVTGYDKIQLFVDEFGHLTADAMYPSMMGPEYPHIVVLT